MILAGDIAKKSNGIIGARAAFPDKEIIYVPGNHEFYGAQRADTLTQMRLDARHIAMSICSTTTR